MVRIGLRPRVFNAQRVVTSIGSQSIPSVEIMVPLQEVRIARARKPASPPADVGVMASSPLLPAGLHLHCDSSYCQYHNTLTSHPLFSIYREVLMHTHPPLPQTPLATGEFCSLLISSVDGEAEQLAPGDTIVNFHVH